MGTSTILKLANYWDVSIDEMIGRSPPSKQISLSNKQSNTITDSTNSPRTLAKTKKSTSHVENLAKERMAKSNTKER